MAADPPNPAASPTMAYAPPQQQSLESLVLPSGRTIAWSVYGGPLHRNENADPPAVVFYAHGFPGSRVEAGFLPLELLQELDACCVSLDRPGMGHSSHYANRRVLDWPGDVLAVANHLKIKEFYIIAVSGGVPYGLACAKEIPRVDLRKEGRKDAPDIKVPEPAAVKRSASSPTSPTSPKLSVPASAAGRLRGIALVSGMYPTTLGVSGMLPGLRLLLGAGAWLPRRATGAMLDYLLGRAARDEDSAALETMLDKQMAQRPEWERAAYQDEKVRRIAIDGLREAFRQSGEGAATELMLVSDWGFGVEEVDGEGVQIWHGRKDRNAPVQMAKEAARRMPGVQLHIFDEEGHLGVPAKHVDEIMKELLSK